MIRHLTITATVLLIFTCGMMKLNAQSKLYVKEKTGTQSAFPLSEVAKLGFSPDGIILTKKDNSAQSFAFGDIRFLSFRNYFTGLPERTSKPEALHLFPNPAGGILQIEYSGKQNEDRTAVILDLQGRVLRRASFPEEKSQLDVSGLASGIYLCRLTGKSGVVIKEFIKN